MVDGAEGVRLAVREELRQGAQQIKVMAGGGITGTYVMAHAYSPASIVRAIEAGVRTIEHGNLVDRPTAQFMAGQTYLVSTLAVNEAFASHADEVGVDSSVRDSLKGLLREEMRAIELCQSVGVKIGFGSDLEGILQPYQLREPELRAKVVTSAQVIASATTINAEILQMQGLLGVVAPGAIADLLVVDGDPLTDLGCLLEEGRHLSAITKAGMFFKNELCEMDTGWRKSDLLDALVATTRSKKVCACVGPQAASPPVP